MVDSQQTPAEAAEQQEEPTGPASALETPPCAIAVYSYTPEEDNELGKAGYSQRTC
jgi:hypothetical protein